MTDIATLARSKRIEKLRKELAQIEFKIRDLESALRFSRRRQDEVNAVLEVLGAPNPDARFGPLFTENEINLQGNRNESTTADVTD